MTQLQSLVSLTLDLPPSCVAFCPSKPHFFVVGTYLLHPRDAGANPATVEPDGSIQKDAELGQLRTGSLILFRLNDNGNGESDMITHVATISTEYAILDVQWAPQVGDLLAVATSTGQLVFYRLDPRVDGNLVLCRTKTVADQSTLVLVLAWHPWRDHVIGLTLSDGSVCLCESTGGELWGQDAVIYQTAIHQHMLEAWTLAFSGPTSMNVLSGGDDCVLQYSNLDGSNDRQLQWQDRKVHDAGITAILPVTSDLVVTGSYDDHIRLITFSPTGRRQVLAEANLGGGVWRLKTLSTSFLPSAAGEEPEITSLVILASCMHAGTRVVRLSKGGTAWYFEVLARFEEHQSMNYGADFQPGTAGAGRRVVSISFYDKLMCLWRFEGGME